MRRYLQNCHLPAFQQCKSSRFHITLPQSQDRSFQSALLLPPATMATISSQLSSIPLLSAEQPNRSLPIINTVFLMHLYRAIARNMLRAISHGQVLAIAGVPALLPLPSATQVNLTTRNHHSACPHPRQQLLLSASLAPVVLPVSCQCRLVEPQPKSFEDSASQTLIARSCAIIIRRTQG